MKQKRLLCCCLALALLAGVPPLALAADPQDVIQITSEIAVPEPVPETPTEDIPDAQEPSDEAPPAEDAGADTGPEAVTEPEPAAPDVAEEPEPDEGTDPSEAPGGPEEQPEAPAGDEALPEVEEEAIPEEEPAAIRVTVPDAGKVIVNPHNMRVSLDGAESTDQIVSAPMPIVNYSSVPVSVAASSVGITPSGSRAVFSAEPPGSDTPDKEIFLYLEFQESPDGSAHVDWDGWFHDAPNQLPVLFEESFKESVLTLPAGDPEPAYGVFRLFGAAAGSPLEMWTAEDTIHVTVAFTFTPVEPTGSEQGFPDSPAVLN